jgi:hypothetical protein
MSVSPVNSVYLGVGTAVSCVVAIRCLAALKESFESWRERREWHNTTIQPRYVHVNRFCASDGIEALAYLQKNGFVVFAEVLNKSECDEAISLLWDWLEEASALQKRSNVSSFCRFFSGSPVVLDRDNSATWDAWPTTVEGGILPYFGAGQSRAAWCVRGNPKVIYFT